MNIIFLNVGDKMEWTWWDFQWNRVICL